MGIISYLARVCIIGSSSLASLLVVIVASIFGLREHQHYRPGNGVEIPASLRGYNVIITGSTSGIGFDTALEFYKVGAHVLIHSSDQSRAEKSAKEIENMVFPSRGRGELTPYAFNLADFDQINQFAAEVPRIMPRVDIFIMNAARMYGLSPGLYNDKTLMQQPDRAFRAKSGHDTVLTVNHLGHFLLTERLLPVLAHGATIVVVTGIGAWDGSPGRLVPPWGYLGTHRLAPRTADDKRIFWEAKGIKQHAYRAYHDSKFANICFGRYLRWRLRRNATVIIHDPGLVVTTPMQSRDSTRYKERHYRRVRSRKLYNWHAPPEVAGYQLLQSTFVTKRPVPDVITVYFFPRQLVSWFASHKWAATRTRFLIRFQSLQKLTHGLHASIGPECDEDLQARLMRWSARAVGLDG